MEEFDSNILHASVGHFVTSESPLTGWPTETLGYYSEVKPEDLREGMEGIVHVMYSHAKTRGRYDSHVTTEFGTLLKVELKTGDEDNIYMSVSHRFPADIEENIAARQYSVYMNTGNWESRGKFYQRHMWIRVDPDAIEAMPHEAIAGLTLRMHTWDGETDWSIVMNSLSDAQWIECKETLAANGEAGALYHLFPKPIKVLRQAEAIPPMPGEKPQPGDNQPGEGGTGTPGEPTPDIPPMPGESRQSVDKDKRGETTELGEGWWGTGRGDK